MQYRDVARAWRDPVFRSRLARETRLGLPVHPAGDARDAAATFEWLLSDEGGVADPKITATAGCGSIGCSVAICTDPCLTSGPSCTAASSLDPCCPKVTPAPSRTLDR